MNSDLKFILIALFGAFCQEVVYWFSLRTKLGEQDTQNLIHSWQYWIITGLMIIVSGIGAWILYGTKELPRDIEFILGAAFPLIFKQLVAGFSEPKKVTLGAKSKTIEVIKNYFQ